MRDIIHEEITHSARQQTDRTAALLNRLTILPASGYYVAFARGSGSERLPESRFFVDGCFGVTFGCTTDPGSDGRGGGGLCVYLYGQELLPSGPQPVSYTHLTLPTTERV